MGRMPKELEDAPKMPDGYQYIWHLFVTLKNADGCGYSEIMAYCLLTGERLTPFEVECVRRIDEAHKRMPT